MEMYAALSKEDIAKLQQARHKAEENLDNIEFFERRMREDPTFAELHQQDYKRVRKLVKK